LNYEVKSLYQKAQVIDNYLEHNYDPARQHAISLKAVGDVVLKFYPDFKLTGSGTHKIIFEVQHHHHTLAFKVGRRRAIENDHKAYKRLPVGIRRKYFARIYWHTHYCLLQEYGEETYVPIEELNQLKAVADKFDLIDVNCDNVRRINGQLKMVDATITEGPTSPFVKTMDSLRYKHPWLYKFAKHVFFLWLLIEKQR
jgi:hypothetical protein